MYMSTLYVIGDSFATGFQQDRHFGALEPEKEISFPNLIAKHINYECVNTAKVGYNNKQIFKGAKLFKPKKKDLVIISWSSPYRDIDEQIAITQHVEHVKELEIHFEGSNLLQVAAFSPLVPYEISSANLMQLYESKTYLGWGNPNSTLIDYATDRFLSDSKKNIQRLSGINAKAFLGLKKPRKYEYLTKCYHFNEDGHVKVANFLYNELRGRFSFLRRSRHAQIEHIPPPTTLI